MVSSRRLHRADLARIARSAPLLGSPERSLLSTVLDDFSRFVVAWQPCATMEAGDVVGTLDAALAASGLDQVSVVHRPRPLPDNGSSTSAGGLATWLEGRGMPRIRGAPGIPRSAMGRHRSEPMADGRDRALAPDAQEPHPA
jgi:transposase InsO family protein